MGTMTETKPLIELKSDYERLGVPFPEFTLDMRVPQDQASLIERVVRTDDPAKFLDPESKEEYVLLGEGPWSGNLFYPCVVKAKDYGPD